MCPLGAFLAENIFQNLPSSHVFRQNKRQPIINQIMFLYQTALLLNKNISISFWLFLSAEE